MTVVSGNGEGANLSAGLVYFVKAFVGPGCLSLPLAFQNCGLALGTGLLFLTSALVTFNLRTMVLCKQHLSFKGIRTYADLTQETLGGAMRRVVELFINGVQLGICAVYFDFFAESAHALLSEEMQHRISLHVLIASIFPVYAALALLRSVDSIAPYAALANALVYAAIGIVLFMAVATMHRQYFKDGSLDGFDLAKPAKVPLFYATVIYSFEGVCSLLPVENALARPREDMPTVMYVGMAVVTMTYASVGAVAYVAWPSVTSGSIAAELSRNSKGRGLDAQLPALIANVSTIIAVVLTFPVQLFPSIELLEKSVGFTDANAPSVATAQYQHFKNDDGIELTVNNPMTSSDDEGKAAGVPTDEAVDFRTESEGVEEDPSSPSSPRNQPPPETPAWKRTSFRVLIVVAIGLVAAIVPNLGALIDLIGALTGSALSLIVPAIIDMRCPRPGRRKWELFVDIFVCAVGIVGAVAGTYQAVQNALEVSGASPESLTTSFPTSAPTSHPTSYPTFAPSLPS